MLKYYFVALILKVFSFNSSTENFYRSVANKKRKYFPSAGDISWKYFFRTEKLFALLRDHDILHNDMKVFELGTGWVHWESTMIRNEVDCTAVLYDVVDNRDIQKYRRVLAELSDLERRKKLDLTRDSLGNLMTEVSKRTDFQSIYADLGFSYLLDPKGRFPGLDENQFDLVISSDVFEHLPYALIPNILNNLYRISKPGAWAYHQIVLTDHLKIYAKSIHAKQYLSYTTAHWNRFLSNGVQYINRVQLREWRELMSGAGFRIVEERQIGTCDLSGLDISPEFSAVPHKDLECTVVQFLLQKPA